jgi:hypothetical protein
MSKLDVSFQPLLQPVTVVCRPACSQLVATVGGVPQVACCLFRVVDGNSGCLELYVSHAVPAGSLCVLSVFYTYVVLLQCLQLMSALVLCRANGLVDTPLHCRA